MVSLNHLIDDIKVSSVFNKNRNEFGKNHLIDGNEETCWSSDQGEDHSISISLVNKVIISEIHIQFQGGYGSKVIHITFIGDKTNEKIFYPCDSSCLQLFGCEHTPAKSIILKFLKNNDIFGRVIVYKLEIIGEKIQN